MISRFLYIILLLSSVAKLFCQDVIVKNDSTKIQVKLLEVKQNELKYKLYNYQEGPNIIISKNDVAYVIYSNGTKEIFNEINETKTAKADSFYYAKPIAWQGDAAKSKKREDPKVGDYIKFNIQAGIVCNSSDANYARRNNNSSHTSSEEYSASGNKYIYNYNIGFNLLFGKNPSVKHVIGINYLRSTGEYNYSYSQGGYTSYSQEFHYVSNIDFINVITGLRFKIFKGFYIEPLASINIIAKADVRYSGTSTTKYISGGPTPTVYQTDVEYVSNKKVDAERSGINSTVSFCPRISYDFNLKKQTLGVYISYNLAYQFRLPWMMAGLTYYPFKKLR